MFYLNNDFLTGERYSLDFAIDPKANNLNFIVRINHYYDGKWHDIWRIGTDGTVYDYT